jgi:hypothetical protein
MKVLAWCFEIPGIPSRRKSHYRIYDVGDERVKITFNCVGTFDNGHHSTPLGLVLNDMLWEDRNDGTFFSEFVVDPTDDLVERITRNLEEV